MTKYFHEEFAKEEAELKISLEASRQAKAERLKKEEQIEKFKQREEAERKALEEYSRKAREDEEEWWDKIPDSDEYGTTKHKQPTEGNHIKKDAYDDRKKK